MTEGNLASPRYRIATIPGDGVGPDVVAAARAVVDAVAARLGFAVEWTEYLVGGAAIDAHGVAIRPEDVEACGEADAILLGAVGGPKWSDPSSLVRPEQALFALRGGLGLYANLRPVTVHPALIASSPVRPELLDGVNLLIVRELTGGLYFGERQEPAPPEPAGEASERHAWDTRAYTEGDPPGRRSRLRAGRRPAAARHERRQGERPRDVAAVAVGRDGDRRRASRRDAGPSARRFVRDAPRPATRRLRRDRDREPVRRHPERRGRRPGGEPRDAPVGVAGGAPDGPRDVRPLRADPRLRAGHRRPRPREPARDDPLRGDAAPALARPGRCRGRDRGSRVGGARRWLPDRGPAADRRRRHRAPARSARTG